jgi:hypothetical protein
MPRNVFNASLFHLSPFAIGWLLRDDTYRMCLAHTPYKGGLLMQCTPGGRGGRASLPYATRPIFELAPPETTHMYFHENAPVLSVPMFDRQEVLDTYNNPPLAKHCNDSSFAKSGFEDLLEDPEFNISPFYFESKAIGYAEEFTGLASDLSDVSRLEDAIDGAYALACGAEHVKLGTDAQWSASDAAFQRLGEALDPIIEAFHGLYSSDLQYTENILLATRSRICRNLRFSEDWREVLV